MGRTQVGAESTQSSCGRAATVMHPPAGSQVDKVWNEPYDSLPRMFVVGYQLPGVPRVHRQESSVAARLIDGVRTKALKVIPDERGRLMEMLRSDDELFLKFGQVYMTTAYPGAVKAWHYHKLQHDNFVVVHGMMKIVLFDGRESSPTHGLINEFFLGVHNNLLLQIPPLIMHGFKCISDEEAIVVNITTMPYNHEEPDEFRLPAHTDKIPYDWARRDF